MRKNLTGGMVCHWLLDALLDRSAAAERFCGVSRQGDDVDAHRRSPLELSFSSSRFATVKGMDLTGSKPCAASWQKEMMRTRTEECTENLIHPYFRCNDVGGAKHNDDRG